MDNVINIGVFIDSYLKYNNRDKQLGNKISNASGIRFQIQPFF